jgi:hypothetical protein
VNAAAAGTDPISGSCHCGNIRFTLHWPKAEKTIAARACGCSFCRKHGGVWTSCPEARLDLSVANPQASSRYRFGTRTADFLICTRCGVTPLVTSDIDSHTYAVVNVNTFDDVGGYSVTQAGSNFDGESTSDRLDRRQRRWIPHVSFR